MRVGRFRDGAFARLHAGDAELLSAAPWLGDTPTGARRDIAYASSREVEYQLSLAVRLGYLEPEPHRELAARCVETSKVLAGLIRALRA